MEPESTKMVSGAPGAEPGRLGEYDEFTGADAHPAAANRETSPQTKRRRNVRWASAFFRRGRRIDFTLEF